MQKSILLLCAISYVQAVELETALEAELEASSEAEQFA